MVLNYKTAVMYLATYYLDNQDKISGDYIDGAITMIHNIYGVLDERIRKDMYTMIDVLMEDQNDEFQYRYQ